jgi:hypothetical protein
MARALESAIPRRFMEEALRESRLGDLPAGMFI